MNSIPKIFRTLLKKSALTGNKSYKVSPQEAAEYEKYYLTKPKLSPKKVINKTKPVSKVKKV